MEEVKTKPDKVYDLHGGDIAKEIARELGVSRQAVHMWLKKSE